jgi:cold shock CspA family protein
MDGFISGNSGSDEIFAEIIHFSHISKKQMKST